MTTARSAALTVLEGCRKRGEWANEGLRKALKGMDAREAALAKRLVYGVLQNSLLLDWYLSQLSSLPLEKIHGTVLNILRLGGYQLLFMDQIPARAAVDEAVKLAKVRIKNPKTAGFVNAILRNLDRRKEEELQSALRESWKEPEDAWKRLSIQYSHPLWLVEEFSRLLNGDREQVEGLLAANNIQRPVTAQVNHCKTTPEALCARLEEVGVHVERHPWMTDCLLLENTGDLEELAPFVEGLFYIQDPAARAAVLAAAPAAGESVLDLCAAPGGKSFAAAVAMGDRGEIVSRDIYPWKVKEIEKGAARLGLSAIRAVVGDASQAVEGEFDLVIADVPCSGLGIIGKKPDIRYKDPETFKALSPIQAAIVDRAGEAVKPGGRLLYATCTLRREENEDQVAAFLRRRGGEFILECEKTIWPQEMAADGFYYAVLRREAGK